MLLTDIDQRLRRFQTRRLRAELGPFRCRLLDDPECLESLANAWDRLKLQSEFVDVFGTAGFGRAWWRAFGRERLLRLVVVEDADGQPRLIAPFYAEAAAPRWWKLIGDFRADYNQLIYARDDRESLRCLFRWLYRQQGWDVIQLQNLPGETTILQHFAGAYEPQFGRFRKLRSWFNLREPLVYRQWQSVHPRIDAAKLATLAHLLQEKNYRKHVNWFQRQGALDYQCVRVPQEIQRRLSEFIHLHMTEWQARGGRSLFEDPQNVSFYSYLVEELADTDALRLDILSLNGKPLAMHFGFTWQGRISYYKPCYDPSASAHSPGKLLLAHILRRAHDERVREVDLLYGLEDYKMQYASDIRSTGSLFIQRSRLGALLARWSRRRSCNPDLVASER